MNPKTCRARTALATILALLAAPLAAEEGMWTLDNLPRKALADTYDFRPDSDWVEKIQTASVRLAGGCSGSLVSPDGLVLTNQHCISRCLAQLSGPAQNRLEEGFLASSRDEEPICPEVEINQLLAIDDVTAEVNEATQGLAADAAHHARRSVMAELESACSDNDARYRCDVVSLYQGGLYQLYRYRRYQDVRLVFAPESAIAAFGGDPDNFSFPRYVLDMGLLRVYEDDAPINSPQHFRLRPAGAGVGELVFVTGHPGSTQRDLTVAQLETIRDLILPQRLTYLAELRGVLRQFIATGEEAERMAGRDYFSVQNSLKAFRGRHAALGEPGFMAAKAESEQSFRAAVMDRRNLRRAYGDAWAEIAAAQQIWRQIYTEYSFLERMRGYQSDLLSIARHLVRAAEEREKPSHERLRAYGDAALPQLTQRLFSAAPIHTRLEKLTLEWSLEKLREFLGPDHPAVRASLGKDSPQTLARRLIDDTGLHDVAARKALWDGGAEAIAASEDPLIRFAARIDGPARAVRQRYEDEVEAVTERHSEQLARARFALEGTDTYPDATFTLRVSYGQVRGWEERGREVPAMTSFGGAYARATGQPPFALPASWQQAENALDLTTPMNFVTTHDIIGGNSGSPVLNRDAELVGLIFDGNLHSLGGAFAYDGRYNRAVAVHAGAIEQALREVYEAEALVEELFE